MVYEILLPLPINKTFYYEQPESFDNSEIIVKGALVEVEFHKKLLIGLVINTVKLKKITQSLKKIIKILRPFSFSKEIIDSINFIAKYSCNNRSLILKLFLSNFPKKKEYLVDKQQMVFVKDIPALQLSPDQKKIVKKMQEIDFRQFNVILLEGVTGSGKTRVYMEKVREVIEKGFQCLILVPEIILTTQWVKEIERDFGLNANVYHSSIKKRERETIWSQINSNNIKLVIGTRSALFLPFHKLGLIVVDEEHDSSYKQEEQTIINARDFSVVRAKNSNCMIILSSATPSLESFYNLQLKKFKSFRLLKRVNNSDMPKIEVVDMKKEVNVISERLLRGIENNLKNNDQTLIFINKRGYAPLIICKNCAYSKICEKCNTSLVLHNYRKPNKSYLLCHHCNYKEFFVNICPKCNTKESFTFPGFGIEKIYEEIKKLFPKAKTCLLSSDSIKDINNFKTTISDITANKINIILGTQLISKGHNFPSLKTVGILNIDNIINDFDFRSFEKTFQQVVQVSGRAGRKKLKGDVIIQTLQPQHPIIRLCQKQDIYDFMKWELKSRMENQQPPYVNYISLIFSSKTEKFVSNFASKTTELIKNNFKQLSIFGPAPAILYRKNLYFRYRLLIKIEKSGQSQNKIKSFLMQIKIPNYIKLYIDVDPINFI